MTFNILTDSTSDLDEMYAKIHQIVVLSLTVTVDDQAFDTFGDSRLTPEALLREMKAGKSVQTSQINSGQFVETFKNFAKKNEAVLYLAFSSGLSGTFQSAVIARDMVHEEFPQAKIVIIDTLAAASGEGFLVEEAVKMRDQGKPIEVTAKAIETLKMHLSSQFMVEDLSHLARGGRIPKAVAIVGTMANIKPLLDVDTEGKLRQVSKVRGRKKAIHQLVEKTLDSIDLNYPRILIGYSGSNQTALEVKKTILDSKLVNEIDIRPIGTTIVTHTGENTLAIFSISNKVRK